MNFMINNNHMAVVKLLLEKMKSPEYKNVLRNDKNHYDLFPSFGHAELDRCKGNANYLSKCVEECVIDFKLEQDDKKLIEQFLTDSSSCLMESSLFDFKSIAFSGFFVALIMFVIITTAHFYEVSKLKDFSSSGLLLVILAGFTWAGVQRRVIALQRSERLKRLAIYFKS
jgi:hypothetical protein